jgi:hypothetical protein
LGLVVNSFKGSEGHLKAKPLDEPVIRDGHKEESRQKMGTHWEFELAHVAF